MRKLPVAFVILTLLAFCFTAQAAFRPSTIGDVFHKGASGFDVRAYGAVGDGSTDDEPAFTLAIAAAAGGRVIIPEAVTSYKLSANVIVPAGVTVVFQQGGLLSIDNTFTFTVNGTIEAGLYQIFSGLGAVSLASGATPYVVPQWWGAVGDGSNDDTSAIQAAIDVAEAINGTVFLPAGVYKTTAALTIQNTIRMYGETMFSSVIYTYGGGNGIELTNVVVPGDVDSTYLAHFRLMADTNTGNGIDIATGSRRVTMYELWIGSNYDALGTHFAIGIKVSGDSYHCRITNCYIYGNGTYGILVDTGANIVRITNNWIYQSPVGVRVDNAEMVVIFNNLIEIQNIDSFHAIELEFAPRTVVTHNYIESQSGTGTHWGIYITHSAGNTFACKLHTNFYNLFNTTEAIFGLQVGSKHQSTDSHSIQFSDEPGQASTYYSMIYWDESEIDSSVKDLIVNTDPVYNDEGHFRIQDTKMILTGLKSRLELMHPQFYTGLGGFGSMLENRFTYSEKFGNAAWTKSNLTVNNNSTHGVDGWLTAEKLLQTSNSGYISQNVTGIDDGQILNGSVYLRDQRSTNWEVKLRWYNVTDGVEAVAATFTVAEDNTWRRFELRHTNSTGGTKEYRFEIYPSDESFTENAFVWGAQCVVETSGKPFSTRTGQGYPYIQTIDTGVQLDGRGATVRTLAASGNIYAFSDSPEVILYNTEAEDADGGRESSVRYKGVQSGGELTTLAMIRASHDGASDDEKGRLGFYVNDGNDSDSPTLVMELDSAGFMPTLTQHLRFTILGPNAAQAVDSEVCIWPVTDAALTITKITVTLDASGNEVSGDLKYADTFIGLANAVVINAFDTTSGVLVDATITSGAVAAGKAIYISFDSAPAAAITQMSVDVEYDYD